jgi:hypothetical protein
MDFVDLNVSLRVASVESGVRASLKRDGRWRSPLRSSDTASSALKPIADGRQTRVSMLYTSLERIRVC